MIRCAMVFLNICGAAPMFDIFNPNLSLLNHSFLFDFVNIPSVLSEIFTFFTSHLPNRYLNFLLTCTSVDTQHFIQIHARLFE